MAKAKKFGALSGVFTPSILTILGVIMYLRLPWIVGQAGLWATIGIILVAHIISFATGLSVASIATDKKVETGGSYYIISRTLGLPIGGTLGLALFVGLSFSISLYLIGFAEVFLNYAGFDVTLNNIRLVGAGALVLLTSLTFISTSLAIKSQYIILTALALSLISVFNGSHEHNPADALLDSANNALPWISLFAIFFPAVTGFEAGVSMSGDLKDPRKNIPAGTISAVLTGLVIYIGLALFFSFSVDRQTLVNDPNVLFRIAWVPELVLVGILGATLSSALGSILGAPRILQATAIDKITPSVLAKGFGASNEPRNALIFTFFIALSGILIGELNAIARIVTIFFIITYGFLNITYAIEKWAGTDFRPSFRIPTLVSIIGALACIIVMIQLDVVAMIGASLVLISIFLFLKRRELTLQTGDTWNSVWSSVVKTGLGKLSGQNIKYRNWRPNVILFSGGTRHRPHLIEMGKALVGKLGIFTNFELIESKDDKKILSKNKQIVYEDSDLKKDVVTRRHHCHNIYDGIEDVSRIYGFTGFEPNTILMGWPKNTKNEDGFYKTLRILKKLDYNLVFLNHDKTFGFGKKKQIDIWWSGQGRNLNFSISLIRFITSSEQWRTAKIRVLVISNYSGLTDKYYELISQVLDDNRIEAEIKVINNSIEQNPVPDIMRPESLHTDLSIIGIEDDQENILEKINPLTESLGTCLIVRSSAGFDEIEVSKPKTDDSLIEQAEPEKPHFTIASSIKPAHKEIISNKVNNTSQHFEQITSSFYKESFEMMLSKSDFYKNELANLVEKTTHELYEVFKNKKNSEIKGIALKISNDFTFHAQQLLKSFRQEVLVFEKQCLEKSTEKYLKALNAHLREFPATIRIKYNWKAFRNLKVDSTSAAIYKHFQIIKARITGKEAVYKIKAERIAHYYLHYKRIEFHKELFNDFYLHSFSNIISLRKVLTGVDEVIEKSKMGVREVEKIKNIVLMEKDRFKAAVQLLEEKNREFYYSVGNSLEKNTVADLQDFSNLLDRPGANFLSKAFEKAFKDEKELQNYITEFPALWFNNIHLFVNKIYLDFLIQSLKNRIESKIKKHNLDLTTLFNSSVLLPLAEIKKTINSFPEKGKEIKKINKNLIKEVNIENFYHGLYDEISSLFTSLPLILPIAGDDLSKQLEEKNISEAQEILISVRKIVEFTIASELIDTTKKQSLESSMVLGKSIHHLKDLIRLINFNLLEENEQTITDTSKETLAEDFLIQVEKEESIIKNILAGLERSFEKGVKNAFAPLSSNIISKTSGTLGKKIRASESKKIINLTDRLQSEVKYFLQKQFVNIVYSRSEGMLWFGKIQKSTSNEELSNEEVYEYLEQRAPQEEIVQNLPFYYAKLFSGQSGTGDDFWIGMDAEILKFETAIKRFKTGQVGCILITGERNSGKTGLSKYFLSKNFNHDQVFNIRAPRQCTADVNVFEQTLLKSLNVEGQDIELEFQRTNKQVVFIINDLEMWWERKESGTQVILRIIEWVKKYSKKVLFVININKYSLKLVHQLTQLQSWSLSTITCNGFDARHLRDIILLRHQAGGMSFSIGRKHESEMNAWDQARLFNRYFDISKGNPGFAINLWIASITKVSGRTLYMRKPEPLDTSFLLKLSKEQFFYLLQFVYHMRLSVDNLSDILQTERTMIENKVLNLWQSGILTEKFPGVYAINAPLHQAIIDKMAEMKLL
ncbi:MAG: hypothetical protein ACLFQS_05715 [Bacteroidales bacterium]